MDTRAIVLAGFGAAALPAIAPGAEWCVDPHAPTCHPTIQAAVDAAGPADLIHIARGVFFENVQVGPGKERLRIVGAGQDATIVDAGRYLDIGATDGTASFRLGAPGVQVTSLTVRNGFFGIVVAAPDALVQWVRVQSVTYGIYAPEAHAGTRVLGNRFDDCPVGVDARGPDAVVRGNAMNRIGTAVTARGDRTLVESNVLEGTLGGIQVLADDAVVRDNVVRNSSSVSLQVTGRNPRVERNTLTEVGAGILIACPTEAAPPTPSPDACSSAVIASNAVTDVLEDALLVLAHSPGVRVERNRVLRSGGSISLNGSGIVAIANTITDSGRNQDIPCFEAFGEDHRLTANVAARCTRTGFLVQASRARVENNRALGGYRHGIVVSGANFPGPLHADVVLEGNTADENVAFGITIDLAVGTTVIGNTALRNHVDFCDSGSGTVATGNTFGTVSNSFCFF